MINLDLKENIFFDYLKMPIVGNNNISDSRGSNFINHGLKPVVNKK